MEDSELGSCLLFPLTAVTLGISLLSCYEGTYSIGGSVAPGTLIRKCFFGCLSFTSFIRFLSLLLELFYLNGDTCMNNVIFCLLVRFTGDILFTTVYSVLILHWITLLLTTSGSPFIFVLYSFITLHSFQILLVLGIAISSKMLSSTVIYYSISYILGISYCLTLCSMLCAAIAISQYLPRRMVIGRKIQHRLNVLAAVCISVSTIEIIYNIHNIYAPVAADGSFSALGYPAHWLLTFDFLKVFTLETVPSSVIIWMTFRKTTATRDPLFSESLAGGYRPISDTRVLQLASQTAKNGNRSMLPMVDESGGQSAAPSPVADSSGHLGGYQTSGPSSTV